MLGISKSQFDAYVADGKLPSNYARVFELLVRYIHRNEGK